MPDTVLALIQAGMLQGKSVGFMRLKSHAPSSHEIAADPAMADVARIIDEWLLIEYACTFLPMNQAALVEAVSKSGVSAEALAPLALAMPAACGLAAAAIVPFTPEIEIHRAIERRIAAFDFAGLALRDRGGDRASARARVRFCRLRVSGPWPTQLASAPDCRRKRRRPRAANPQAGRERRSNPSGPQAPEIDAKRFTGRRLETAT